MIERLSQSEARRIALHAQGFGTARPDRPGQLHLRRTIDRLSLHQIDSVNVVARAHYLPAFSRLGNYDRTLLDRDAWGPRRSRRLFEYWAHEASLLPLALHPLLRWRMAQADRGESGWKGLRGFATERRHEAMAVLDRIRAEGPLGASDFETSCNRPGWWEWGETKQALEWLFWAGHLTTSTRRAAFERVYDLPERVLPASILDLPTPEPGEAQRGLIALSARALGVASAAELRDYFQLKPEEANGAIADLLEEGLLHRVAVEGWRSPAFLYHDAHVPRRIAAQALLAPFDPLIWERSRTERLFDFHYRIGIYTPAAKRTHGYYVLPFLLGDRLVGRADLKADRQQGRLLVHSVHFEPAVPAESRDAMAAELSTMARWLGLEEIVLPMA